jgi:predicted ribosome quality control (RQC) complex YloA/Tae2 family protein
VSNIFAKLICPRFIDDDLFYTDLWFHVRDCPSAHVVLFTNGETVSRTAVIECALLAKQHSKLKGCRRCTITWADAKHVSKGKMVGQAIVSCSKELVV